MSLHWEEQREFFRDARRARYLARLVGKAADLIVAMSLWHIPGAAGVFAALFYLLMCDGFPGGRSLGKWLTGLKVVRIDRDGMDFTASLMRNLPVAAPFLFYLFPVIGPFFAYTVGISILLIETYLGFYDPDGQRAGDTFAETLVVEYRQGSDGVPLSDRRA
ncbi:MAG: RDD family protein [Candidatus Deferrimicrobium sp.]